MLRSTGIQGKILVSAFNAEWAAILDDLHHLALEAFPNIKEVYRDPEFASRLNNRQRERWLPLLAVANTFCPEQMAGLERWAPQDTNNPLVDPIDAGFLGALNDLVDRDADGGQHLRPSLAAAAGERRGDARVYLGV